MMKFSGPEIWRELALCQLNLPNSNSLELLEHHRSIALQKYPFFEYQPHSPRKRNFLRVPARLNHRRCGVGVIHRDDVLGDDWPGVEVVGDDVSCGADDFDTAHISLVIGFSADECRQERMVDIDHPVAITGDKSGREDAHVLCQ